MNPLTTLPLRVTIPLALLLLTLLADGFTVLYNRRAADADVEQQGMAMLAQDMTELQYILNLAVRKQDWEAVRMGISHYGANPQISMAALVDDTGSIVASSSLRLLNVPASRALPGMDQAAAQEMKRTQSGMTRLAGDRHAISAYFPITLGVGPGDIRPTRVGTLYVEHDLTGQKAQRRYQVERQSLMMTGFLACCYFLLFLFLHLIFARRVTRLVKATTRFSSGDLSAKAGLQGQDELAQVGAAFERMAEEIGRNHRALQEAAQKYRIVADNTYDWEFWLGPGGDLLYISPSCERVTGYAADEFRADPELQDRIVHPEDRGRIQHHRHDAGELREPGSLEFRIIKKDGAIVWIDHACQPVVDEHGAYLGIRGNNRDVTERKYAEEAIHQQAVMLEQEVAERQMAQEQLEHQTVLLEEEISERRLIEEALRKSEAQLREAQRVAHIGSWELDIRRNELTWSEEVYRIFELDATTFGASYDAFLNAVHPDDRKLVNDAYSHSLETGNPYSIVHRLLMPDGRIKYIHEQCESFYDDGGAPLRSLGTVQDITERALAEREVRRVRNYLSNIINSMPAILVGMDTDAIVTQWNRHAEEATGVAAADALGRPFSDLIPDFTPWIESMRNQVQQRRPASMEKVLIEKNGDRTFYDLMLYPLVANGVEGSVVRIEDVTEQARTQELMVQTEKMMSVGGLAAGMAHEINNPLGIITQAAQNIERRMLSDLPVNRQVAERLGLDLATLGRYLEERQIPEFIAGIREATTRASRIIGNMLRFSRQAAATMEYASLSGIVDQAVELAASDYDLKKKYDFRAIEIVRDYQPDMPDVLVVAVEIEQVILNILKNAAQAMIANTPERKPRIVLRIRSDERYAVVEIADNGPGMIEDIRRRVFEPFFTTKEPGTGTGLGLSVSYMIVTQNHKGLMEVASSPGNGARFTISLPLGQRPPTGSARMEKEALS